jgi:hypothetical protein
MKHTKKRNTEFNFDNAIVRYEESDPRWRLIYVRYLTDDTLKNKEVDQIIKDFWYTRNRLVKSYPLWEVFEWFEYKRLGIYINNEYKDELKKEKDRRDHIRNAPVI